MNLHFKVEEGGIISSDPNKDQGNEVHGLI
jgi:hypothetical protein